MATFIRGSNIGEAWLRAFEAIDADSGSIVNLAVDIADPTMEDVGVRRAIEACLAEDLRLHPHKNIQSIHTVANTIFPISLYRPSVEGAAERFFANALKAEASRKHASNRRWGSYLGRLVAYPSRDGDSTNQLARILDRLNSSPKKIFRLIRNADRIAWNG